MKRFGDQQVEDPAPEAAPPINPVSATEPAPLVTLGVNEPIPAAALRPAWAGAVLPAKTLSLAKLNEMAEKRGNLGGRPISDPTEVFTSTHIMSLGEVLKLGIGGKAKAEAMAGGASEGEAEAAAAAALAEFAPLIGATSAPFMFQVPRHLNVLPEEGGALGQRVVYYGVEGGGAHGLRDLKRVLLDLVGRGCMMDKNTVHTALEYPGGTPEQVMSGEGKQQGVTHGGRIALAWNAGLDAALAALDAGEDVGDGALDSLHVAWYDQPAGYDRPTRDDSNYWASLSVFDPETVEWGSGEAPDAATRRAWVENAEIWSALDILTVPFAYEHPNPAYQDYKRNPVEVKKAADLGPFLNLVLTAANGTLGEAARKADEGLRWYAVYCEEGVVNVKNAGLSVLLSQASVDAGKISAEAFEAYKGMVAAFQGADGWEQDPAVGWAKLVDEGFITAQQLRDLEHTGHIHQRLRLMDEGLKPWTDYAPVGVETDQAADGCGFYTRAVTVAILTANFVANNYPREELVKGFVRQIEGVMAMPEGEAARAVLAGLMASKGLGEGDAAGLARQMAADFQGAFVDLQMPYLHKVLRVKDMEGPEDKARIEAHFKEFRDLVVDPSLERDELVVKIKEVEERFRDVTYTLDGMEVRGMQWHSPLQGVEGPKGGPFMPQFVGHRHLAFLVGRAYKGE
ncbi:unnamed protein product [Ostreobium quekettii]|uniref:Uncharacterized protein n=1 Tax=Ostreobium quekettii TaxID=121088 RepID=A0A8S1IQQ8_9CHLO|nr:unnamed protein product [Ostreobium quekettii]|eukprot:evm.model.scf_239.6 EVM.evm.TU.scf_239.6   scf_239:103600-106542(-)